MKIAVVFDTLYQGWGHDEHLARMKAEFESEPEPEHEYQIAEALISKGHEVLLVGVYDEPAAALDMLRENEVDMVFNAAESFQGNDDLDFLIPALLESGGFPYTGSPPQGLMVTRNKSMSKRILAHHGVHVPGFVVYRLDDEVALKEEIEFPAIVKPLRRDASVGIAKASVVRDEEALLDRVKFVHERLNDAAIIEEFIDGRELYTSMIGNNSSVDILPLMELVFDKEKTKPEERIATRQAKWDDPYRERMGIRNVFARPISRVAQERLETACRTAYRALWLRDYGRLDLRLDADDEVWVLEANANPFISYGHEVAKSAEKAGLDYDDFIDRIVQEAVKRYQ
jgi:D-alanine-D-alanine ligase